MGRTKGTATIATQRRGTLCGYSSRFPPKRKWRIPGHFLSSRGEVRMDPYPGEEQEREGVVRGNEKNGNADSAKKKDAVWSSVFFLEEVMVDLCLWCVVPPLSLKKRKADL